MSNPLADFIEEVLAELDDKRLYEDEGTIHREILLMDLESQIDIQERIQWGGINYDDWDDFNYWEEKEATIPWKGNGD